ncbi:MAG TPA: tRNA (N6-isopentenyl adenosine(37)-C2)-methylthiotransferase MiaB [Pyrinomonadaceae bacterium]|nr:tRNA (N6-isopentenyl adenosine(37)-C2)-methylthiotransferase MiaB [Pyrinomonadaceae bacterium]
MKKVYLETFGCQMNVSDSERVATSLAAKGFEMTADELSADVVLINTCSVREKAEQKLYTRVGRVRKDTRVKPVVGVLGCVAQLEGETLYDKIRGIDFVIGTKAVGRVADAIEKVYDGEREVTDLGDREPGYDWSVADAQRHSKYVGFVPIIEGCNKFCTYCIVPFSRGREVSLTASEIIRHVLELRRQGVKEIHLIGQNVNSYRPKSDSGMEAFRGATPFARLLRAVAATGIERIKFNTSFPRDFHPDIIDAINENENLCNWVHLPVQSGSDRVLKMMKRGHTIDSYFQKIDKLKESSRDIALTTDIIVGFPGETEADFADTKKAVEYCGYDSAYIFKYSPRPGTPAYAMEDDVTPGEKKLRFLELEQLQKRSQNRRLQRYVGKTVQVLAEKVSSRNESDITGHSTCHKLVNFQGSGDLIGSVIDVRIREIKANSLFGEVC